MEKAAWNILKNKQINEAKLAKKIFDLCNKIGEGVHDKLHIIDTSEGHGLEDEKQQFRVYHSDGYCFDISMEPIEIGKDECNYCSVDNKEYQFMDGIYNGFKECSLQEAIFLIKKI